jgi:hypothetical protein
MRRGGELPIGVIINLTPRPVTYGYWTIGIELHTDVMAGVMDFSNGLPQQIDIS